MPRGSRVDDAPAAVLDVLQFAVNLLCALTLCAAHAVTQCDDVVSEDDVPVLTGERTANADACQLRGPRDVTRQACRDCRGACRGQLQWLAIDALRNLLGEWMLDHTFDRREYFRDVILAFALESHGQVRTREQYQPQSHLDAGRLVRTTVRLKRHVAVAKHHLMNPSVVESFAQKVIAQLMRQAHRMLGYKRRECSICLHRSLPRRAGS